MTPLQIAAFIDLDDVAGGAYRIGRTGWPGSYELFLATERGNLDVCKILITAGADCDAHAGGSNVVSIISGTAWAL